MTNRTASCEWVRTRLPLEIGPDDDGLDARDHAKVARHLAGCAGCRRHRAGLLDAMTALSALAAAPPVGLDAPSLWTDLESRIREQERMRESGARRPSRLRAWLAASLEDCPELFPDRGVRLRPGFALGGLAAALFGGVILFQAYRTQARVGLEIARGARPIVPAAPAGPVLAGERGLSSEIDVAAEEGGDRWLWAPSPGTYLAPTEDGRADEASDRPGLPGALAQAEIPPNPRQAPASSSSTGGAGSSGAPSGTNASSSKYDFDLERGTPMAPDSRDAKLAY